MSLVSCRLIYSTPIWCFQKDPYMDPQLRVQVRLISPYFQASKLAYYCFMDAGKINETLVLETKVLVNHSTAGSMSISMLISVPCTPSPARVQWKAG